MRTRQVGNPKCLATLADFFADEQVNWSDNSAPDGEALWAMTDKQGSVNDVIDSNADLRAHRRYDGFGGIVGETHYNPSGTAVTAWQTGYLDEAFAYTGRWLDKATGLQNNLNRWYDSKTGRWLSEDPIGFAAGDANLYRYVGNEPTRYSDPSGQVEGPYCETWGDPPIPEPPGGPHPNITGGPWKWCPDSQNPRGGIYAPKEWKGFHSVKRAITESCVL